MRLFYAPGASSPAPHIVLRELDLPFALEQVERDTKRTSSGEDFLSINPKGYVPALQLDDGTVLTEGPAITQYLADRYAPGVLAPLSGTLERARLNAYLTFIGTELHKPFDILFDPAAAPASLAAARRRLDRWFGILETTLADGRTYLNGAGFTLADAYLFVVLSWCPMAGVALARFPLLSALAGRVRRRPAVERALLAEGIADVERAADTSRA
ncbi:MAG: glutathione S-transferase N-terminal domain-containing protein [Burkholderia gladioli]